MAQTYIKFMKGVILKDTQKIRNDCNSSVFTHVTTWKPTMTKAVSKEQNALIRENLWLECASIIKAFVDTTTFRDRVMESSTKIGIIGAVLFFICVIGLLGFGMLALPSLVEKDYNKFTDAAYYSIGFGIVAFLGFMIWMVAILLALTKEK